MTEPIWRDRAYMSVSGTPATGAITLSSAISGYDTWSTAGITNGARVRYTIIDGAAFEIGEGTYSTTGPTLTRSEIIRSTNSNNAISCTSAAKVLLVLSHRDILSFGELQTHREQADLYIGRQNLGFSGGQTVEIDPCSYPYSAAGNGTNDDTTNFQAAIDAASLGGDAGGVVRLHGKTFLITTLNVNNHNVVIEGPGIIKLKTNTASGGIFLNGVQSGLRNLIYDGNKSNQSTSNINIFMDANGTFVEGCQVKACKGPAIVVDAANRFKIRNNRINDLENYAVWVVPTSPTTIEGGEITGNTVEDTTTVGILVGSGGGGMTGIGTITGTRVTNNWIENCGMTNSGGGIWFRDFCTEGVINNNICHAILGDAIHLDAVTNFSVTGNVCTYASGITGNIENPGFSSWDAAGYFSLTGNTFYGNGGPGANIIGGTAVISVVGNVCVDNGAYSSGLGNLHLASGIAFLQFAGQVGDSIAGSASIVTCSGNTCFDSRSGTSRTQHYGIYVDTTVQVLNCIGNTVWNNRTAEIFPSSNSGSNWIILNRGYNGQQGDVTPSVPLSATPLTNPYAYPVQIFMYGGTVSAVLVNGVSTGLIVAGTFYLLPSQTIQINYTGAPTWKWVGM